MITRPPLSCGGRVFAHIHVGTPGRPLFAESSQLIERSVALRLAPGALEPRTPHCSAGRSARVIDTELMENNRQLIHQRNIDVALGVFDSLGGLGHLDGRGPMHPCFISIYLRESACATASLSKICANEPVGCSFADWSIFSQALLI